MTRKYTNLLLDAIEQGMLSPQAVVEMAVSYMSESDVEDMMRVNDLLYALEPEEDDEPDVSEAQEWYDFDPEC